MTTATETPLSPAEARPAAEVPSPPLPRVLQSWLAVAHPVAARVALRKRYGDLFATDDAIVGRLVHVADRALVEQVFKWKPAQYNVSEPRQIMEPAVGASSILLLDGARHMRMRKLMLPPFHGEAIARYADVVEEVTAREIASWRPGQTVRMRELGQAVTLEVIIRAVFGITDPARVAELKRLLPGLASINPFLLLLPQDRRPRSPWGRFFARRAQVDAMVYAEIGRRRAEGEERPSDILGLLLAARDEDGEPLTDAEVRDELLTMLLAGHETTATSIAWAFERLLRTPDALARLAGEVRSDGHGGPYMDAVVKETMRVRPVIPEVFRAPARRVELGGYVFEPGMQLAVSILLLHLDERLYAPDPQAFRPERFLDGAPEPYAWIPFGGGVRRCLGAAFAQLEMEVVIATILARVRLRAPRPADEKVRFRGVALLPHRGGEVVVEGPA